jgi:toxin HigB-1
MKIEFADPKLAVIRTDRAAAELRLPIGVIKSCREKLIVIEDAPDERVLRNWSALRYKKLKGDMQGKCEVRLNDQYRIVFILDESQTPPIFRILEIGDIH